MAQVFRYPPVGGSTLAPGAATSVNQVLEIAQLTAINANTTGVATAANQATEIASLASIDTKLTAPLSVTGPLTDTQLRASAVPVSAASLPLPAGASTSALQTTGNTSLASIDSKLTAPLSVTGPLTDAELRATPVPVSISSGISNPLPVQDSAAEASLASIDSKLTNPLPVSAASLPLPSGASTSALQTSGNASLVSIDSKLTAPLSVTGPLTDTQLRATPVPVSGTVSTGGLTDTELRATPVPVSASSLPLPSGASTSALQTSGNASLVSIDSKLTAPLSVTGPLTDTQLRATPVPVSGTVSTGGLTDAELRATPVPVSAASLPLPSGAATSANQATEIASLASIDSKLTSPITITGALTDTQLRATPVPISGTVTANAGTNLNTSALNLEATQVSFSNKSASAFINSPFDETVITYVGATTNISTVVYKLATVTVNTLTMTYDGSNRLTDVVKT